MLLYDFQIEYLQEPIIAAAHNGLLISEVCSLLSLHNLYTTHTPTTGSQYEVKSMHVV